MVINAVETVRESVSEVQGMEINGGDSAVAPNGSRVELIGASAAPQASLSSGNTQSEPEPTGDLFNKQDGNRDVKNRAQRKPATAVDSDTAQLIELPPAAPITVRGRPVILTPELLEQLCQLITLGFSRAQAAAYLGLSRSTITKAMQRDRDLQAELARAEELSELQPQLTIMAEARKNWRAAAWLLKFKAKHHRRMVTKEDEDMDHQEHLEGLRRINETMKVLHDGELPQREPELKVKIRRGKR